MLLKWAGGKRQLLPALRRFYPPAFNRCIEPFFGSAAVFFDFLGVGRSGAHDAVLRGSKVHACASSAPRSTACSTSRAPAISCTSIRHMLRSAARRRSRRIPPSRFDGHDQQALQRVVIELARRGCQVVLSNSTADEI